MPTQLTFSRLDGEITAVLLDGVEQTETPFRSIANRVTYSAIGQRDTAYSELESVVPYNRPYQNASIITAQPGDFCDIIVNRVDGVARLYIHTERDDLYDCERLPIEDF